MNILETVSTKAWLLLLSGAVIVSGAVLILLQIVNGTHFTKDLSSIFSPTQVLAVTASATTTNENANGIYVYSQNLVNAKNNLPNSIYTTPYIDGVVVNTLWNQIEPSSGVYDWSLLDAEVTRAVANNKKITISVAAGGFTPTWLYVAPYNVPSGTFYWASHNGTNGNTCEPYVLPVPWNSTYEQAYATLMQALSAHLKSIPGAYADTSRVDLTGINTITSELHLGFCPQSTGLTLWQQLGYTPNNVISAGEVLGEAVNTAFPDKVLSLSILVNNAFPLINNSGQIIKRGDKTYVDVTQSLINFYSSTSSGFADRLAVQWDGFYSGLTNPAPEVIAAGQQGSIVGWQLNDFGGLKYGTGCGGLLPQSAPCTDAGYESILDSAINYNGHYLEVFPINVPQFPNALTEAQSRLKMLALPGA